MFREEKERMSQIEGRKEGNSWRREAISSSSSPKSHPSARKSSKVTLRHEQQDKLQV